jgi:hypothetical protein
LKGGGQALVADEVSSKIAVILEKVLAVRHIRESSDINGRGESFFTVLIFTFYTRNFRNQA